MDTDRSSIIADGESSLVSTMEVETTTVRSPLMGVDQSTLAQMASMLMGTQASVDAHTPGTATRTPTFDQAVEYMRTLWKSVYPTTTPCEEEDSSSLFTSSSLSVHEGERERLDQTQLQAYDGALGALWRAIHRSDAALDAMGSVEATRLKSCNPRVQESFCGTDSVTHGAPMGASGLALSPSVKSTVTTHSSMGTTPSPCLGPTPLMTLSDLKENLAPTPMQRERERDSVDWRGVAVMLANTIKSIRQTVVEAEAQGAQAIKMGKPVVALETAVVTHGMPHPINVEMAIQMEEAVRECGAIPATVGIIDGVPVMGLSRKQLMQLSDATEAKTVIKVGERDLGYAYAHKAMGGTTVSGTMAVCQMAGVKIFATGGIGGVHRPCETAPGIFEETGDVSNDIIAFSKYQVLVVSAGVKAILSVPRTVEAFETGGVPLVGYKCTNMPCFYSTETSPPIALPHTAASAAETAAVFDASSAMQRLSGQRETGLLLVNPIAEADSLPLEEVDAAIKTALKEMVEQGVSGKGVTPFLLARMTELTGGVSLEANKRLLLNNARVAAEVAVELSKL
ncbi:pseudouridine-5'-phosphate glycosidase [Kipferlia bialata]|uniref:Pseudouridine-5'-phosphate glycosidase n=1 Tax=Kipferlia bialata TaxID=797122 RepID=A0A9K3CNJ4_9EUKA|nr:pseudouridine-5'-phosphate glycosidase [Kipferlia bialata]|eukprot:g142.t1